jgi:outer membrane immunogenic protein
MKKFFAFAAISSSLASLGASAGWAADPVTAAYDWTGFYLGAQAGYAWSDSTSHAFGNFGAGTVSTADLDADGFLGGLYSGYNFHSGGLVWGLEADINFVDLNSGDQNIVFGGVSQLDTHKGDMDWNGAARLRLGYAVDHLLPYIAGGVAFGGYKVDYDHTGASGTLDETLVGWTLGGGIEYAFSDSVTSRIEYRYSDYGSMDGSVFAAFPAESQDADLEVHDIRWGIAFRF